MEVAVCESPASAGRSLSNWDLDELLALTTLLIEAASDSDAIYWDLIEPALTVWANGEYTLDRAFYERVIQPFIAAYTSDEFRQAATSYESLYRDRSASVRLRLDETLSPAFINAFTSEFRITPDDVIDVLGELVELAAERNSVVVETTIGELRGRLIARGLSTDTCTTFVSVFALFHRPNWDRVPVGFRRKDISPWRYGRRLSVTARPLLVFGVTDSDTVIYGLGTLRQSLAYLLDRTERGQMPADFFTTDAMKAYLGAVNHERGHAFAESVAEALRRDGWQARTSVKMRELSAPIEYGDLDVLAWTNTGRVQLIECKRLQLARTVAEVGEVCRRFRGEAMDELAKHMRRVTWIQAHASSVSKVIGIPVIAENIEARVITDVHVPMQYLESLPIPPQKIGPLNTPL